MGRRSHTCMRFGEGDTMNAADTPMFEAEGESGANGQSFEEANEQALRRCGAGPFQGTLKKVGKKFGFIKCEVVEREFQKDVFVSNHVIPQGSNVIGSKVNFKLKLSEKGEPQADNLTIFSQPQRIFANQKAQSNYRIGNSGNVRNGSFSNGHVDHRNGNGNNMGSRNGGNNMGPAYSAANGNGVNNTNRLMGNKSGGGQGNYNFRGGPNPKNGPTNGNNLFNNGTTNGNGNPLLSQNQQRGFSGLSHTNNGNDSAPTNQIYTGVLKALFSDKMYGFIACREVHRQWSRDVFLDREEIEMAPDLAVGIELDFVLSINEKGQPVAKLLPPNGIFRGVLKMYLPSRGYGFIRCPDTIRVFGSDAFVHKKEVEQAPALEVGDPVVFSITLNAQGQPQAVRVASYQGTIISRGNFMFILCDDAKRRYGQDVFLLKSQTNGCGPNDEVQFSVVTNQKGQPQAQNVQRNRPNMGNNPLSEIKKGGDTVHEGVVKSMGEKYGFIRMKGQNCDVFFLTNSTDPVQVGDEIQFNMTFNEKNQLQARNMVRK